MCQDFKELLGTQASSKPGGHGSLKDSKESNGLLCLLKRQQLAFTSETALALDREDRWDLAGGLRRDPNKIVGDPWCGFQKA
jgi:hypothetical protein